MATDVFRLSLRFLIEEQAPQLFFRRRAEQAPRVAISSKLEIGFWRGGNHSHATQAPRDCGTPPPETLKNRSPLPPATSSGTPLCLVAEKAGKSKGKGFARFAPLLFPAFPALHPSPPPSPRVKGENTSVKTTYLRSCSRHTSQASVAET